MLLQFWSWAKGLENRFDSRHRYPLHELLGTSEEDGEKEITVVQEDLVDLPTLRQRTSSGSGRFRKTHLLKGATVLPRLPVFAL